MSWFMTDALAGIGQPSQKPCPMLCTWMLHLNHHTAPVIPTPKCVKSTEPVSANAELTGQQRLYFLCKVPPSTSFCAEPFRRKPL